MQGFIIRQLLPAALCCACGSAWAAGGHHSVDDAAILDTGQCQLETWSEVERSETRTLLHVGPACRIGFVELGLNFDSIRAKDAAPMPRGCS